MTDPIEEQLVRKLRDTLASSESEVRTLRQECSRLRSWVSDCQAGMYINCVYCGHRYGPDDEVPAAMADVLKEHIKQCPDHPMSACKNEVRTLRQRVAELETERKDVIETVGYAYDDSRGGKWSDAASTLGGLLRRMRVNPDGE